MSRIVIKRSLKRIMRHFRLADKRGPSWATQDRIHAQVVRPLMRLDRHGVNHTNMDNYLT